MRIAFLIPRLVQKGPVIVVRDLVEKLIDKVDLIHVYHFGNENAVEFKCPTFEIGFFHKINFDHYDIVHSHMLKPDLYILVNRKKRYSGHTRFVSTLHQNILDNMSSDYNKLLAYLIEKVWLYALHKHDAIVTLTDVMRREYIKSTGRLNFQTIYNGRSTSNISTIENNFDLKLMVDLKKRYRIIGTHCLLTKRKGVDQIIKAIQVLPGFCAVVLGDGDEKDVLIKLAHELGISERVFFLGFKQNPIGYLSFFDAYIMSSSSEGFPLALLEAGAIGIPVVCSDIAIFRELFSDEDVCFFELNNIDSLALAIQAVVTNRELFSKSIQLKIKNQYSIEKMATRYHSLFLNLMNVKT